MSMALQSGRGVAWRTGPVLPARRLVPCSPSTLVRVQSGRAEPFNENAAQVKRLINRDRKEFLGNSDDILDKYETEFGAPGSQPSPEAPAQEPVRSTAATSTAPRPVAPSNPFGSASSSSNPFGAAPPAQPFKSKSMSAIEPKGLRPDMSPDPVAQEKGFNLFESITLTQIVLVLSFSLIIALMISTFYFVLSVGGIRLNGI